MTETDSFWEVLLALIKEGRVIPVIGERAVTFGADDTPLVPHLAQELARRLAIGADRLPLAPTLTDVACEWLVSGGTSGELYRNLYLATTPFDDDKGPAPGTALRALASISRFNLFLTTTGDPLLARAIVQERPGVTPVTCGFCPKRDLSDQDLPKPESGLIRPTVYHLFGRTSMFEGESVLWEEDVLDFVCDLHATFSGAKGLQHLSGKLKDNALLVIGPNFSDLLVRLFLRVAKQHSLRDLSRTETTLAEPSPGFGHRGNILLFGGVLKNVRVRRQDPIEFALQLADRWRAKNPEPARSQPSGTSRTDMPDGAIFISYAREDEAVAKALSQALAAHGCSVWYDRERLNPGAKFNDHLQDAVSRSCSLFISLISSTTEGAEQGYWRRERAWAIERVPDFHPDEFYIPVYIPPIQFPFLREPTPVSKALNAVSLPAVGTAEFVRFAEFLRAVQVRRSVPT